MGSVTCASLPDFPSRIIAKSHFQSEPDGNAVWPDIDNGQRDAFVMLGCFTSKWTGFVDTARLRDTDRSIHVAFLPLIQSAS